MDTDIDWRRELDSSFGTGHDVPVGHYVASGHRAVRRRRAGAAVAGLAATVVVGGAVWSLAPGSSPRGTEAPIAHEGGQTSRASGARTDEQAREQRRRSLAQLRRAGADRIDFLGNPAALADGGFVLAAGAGPVLERVANPMGYSSEQGTSLGLRVMFRGEEQYSLLTSYDDGASTSTSTVASTGDFPGWLDQAVRTQRSLDVANGVTPSSGETVDGPWLVLTAGGSVRGARDGVVVTESREEVDLGASFADGATRTGAVRLVVDGRTEYAAYRVVGGTLDVVPGGGRFDSMAAFLEWARAQYASGTGMR